MKVKARADWLLMFYIIVGSLLIISQLSYSQGETSLAGTNSSELNNESISNPMNETSFNTGGNITNTTTNTTEDMNYNQHDVYEEAKNALYDVKISAINNVITGLETARFQVVIRSLRKVNDTIAVKFGLNNLLFANTKPSSIELNGIKFIGKETKKFEVELKPMRILPGSIYSVSLMLSSENYNFEKRIPLRVYYDVIPVNRTYETLLKIEDVRYPLNLDPRKEFNVKVIVRNFFPKEEKNVSVRVISPLFDFSKRFEIGANERKEVVLRKKLDPKTKPQFLSFEVRLERNNTILMSQNNLPFRIISYEDIEKGKNSSSAFFRKKEVLIYKNHGNDIYKGVIKIPINFFSKLFISTNHKQWYIIRNNQGEFLAFDLALKPGEEYVLIVTHDYRGLFFIVLAIGVIIWLYYLLRSPIVIKKDAHILSTKDGGIKELKVIISVKNRSHRAIRKVRISEVVPKIAEVNLDLPAGVLSPTKVVKNEHKGTLVRWDIEKMEGLEERIISLVIKSKLSILGSFRLKPTYVSFLDLNKERRVKSKELVIRI